MVTPEIPSKLNELINDPMQWTGGQTVSAPDVQSKEDLAKWYAENPDALFSVDPFDDTPIGEGNRNNDMARIAGKIMKMHEGSDQFTSDDLTTEMMRINKTRCNPPLEVEEVEALSNSIYKTVARKNIGKNKDTGKYNFNLGSQSGSATAVASASQLIDRSGGLWSPPDEKPELSSNRDIHRASAWIMHNSVFKPADANSDMSLVFIAECFYLYTSNCWRTIDDDAVALVLQTHFFSSPPNLIKQVIQQLKFLLYLPVRDFPFWKGGTPPGYPADCRKLIPFNNGLFDVEHYVSTGDMANSLKPHHHGLFNTIKLNYDFDPQATCPRWDMFLEELWGKNSSRAESLQEWAGHTMIPDISQQKICLMHGVPRSGKSTIGRILFDLIGIENSVSTDLHALSTEHGPSALVGKNLAVLFDAHLPTSNTGERALEKLKGISGADPQTINPKFQKPFTVTLNTRLMIICNEVPKLRDSGNALLARLIPFRFDRGFQGQEDTKLGSKLTKELPGIANWAIEGIRRYITQGYLSKSTEATDDLQQIKRVLNPVAAFVDDCVSYTCNPQDKCKIDDMYLAWKTWCETQHIYAQGTKDRFLSTMRTICPPSGQTRVDGVLAWAGLKMLTDAEQIQASESF